MTTSSRWGITPQQSVAAQVDRLGPAPVVERCLAMLRGGPVEPEFVYAMGGPPARWAVDGGVGGPDHWLRVWGLRGLLWNFEVRATPAVVAALGDEEWRVRELAAKVCARHGLEAALPRLAELGDDPRPRVRKAAERALLTIQP